MVSAARTDRASLMAGDERELVDGLLAGREEAVAEFLGRSHHAVYFLAARLSASNR